MALKQVKNKIIATQKTGKVTKAMEAVSAVKMRKSQLRALETRTYAETALRILERVSHVQDAKRHPLLSANGSPRTLIIVVTSDKGLAGSLNSAVLKETNALLEKYNASETELICFGRKSYEHFTYRGFTIPRHYLNVRDEVTLADFEEVVAFVTAAFLRGDFGSVHIVYQSFISTFEQEAVHRQLLPLKTEALQEIVRGIVPRQGKYSDIHLETKPVAYTVEPNQEAVYNALFPTLIKIMVYHALLENKASEHSARMIAMKNATDKAKEMARDLTLLYNKKRQAVITAEVSEITGGIEAMKDYQ